MNVRLIREEDIEQVIGLFRLNYGDDYIYTEFYDPQWVKRGIYSDNILWLVIEEEGRIVASGAAVLDAGDTDDQIAELGRLVVDPSASSKGLGQKISNALIEASNNQVEFLFAEARTVHPKSQKILEHVGLVALGFLPMAHRLHGRESVFFYGQLSENGRKLRQEGAARVIALNAPIAALALSHMELDEAVKIVPNPRSYPLYERLEVKPLAASDLVRLLKIEHGRTLDPEVFGGLHLDQGVSKMSLNRASYLVAVEEGRTLGAVGTIYSESDRSARIVELIARDDSIKGGLLRLAVEKLEQVHQAEMIKIDVSAYYPGIQRTMVELGFLPAAYVPGMIFHNTQRWDVVRMVKLNVDWDLGPLELVPQAQAMYDLVTMAFIRRDAQRRIRQSVSSFPVFQGFSALELDFVVRLAEDLRLSPGKPLVTTGLCVVLEGGLQDGDRQVGPGECFGGQLLLTGQGELSANAGPETHLMRLSLKPFNDLCERYPHTGLKLVRNLIRL